ncbi:Cobalamin biosynthesis protein CobD [Pleomorphomonas sp. T1.2MG-36]|uniref:adenosylcobinamide-phosphate synthase CbiB n=1 Tax=Pleomorphomonas sp. T1.2MG-36 TaxID=3041167 RepID=UPI00247756C5|nr:adenosylcobinamide-phosphate synthase CbiB [Pleomorphomonas sp. T1.2MG-36]CAI9412392.1 Cobalamin biosynthesis protein CobD [Pleomorphomonas sp. T1.2MG-36]
MVPLEFLLVALLALVFEVATGYPDFVFRLIGHPVTWMGTLIGFLDRTLNREDLDADRRRLNGVLAAAVNVAASALVAAAIGSLVGLAGPIAGPCLAAIVGSTLLAARSLYVHVAAVADAMRQGGLEAGRLAVGRIVGRNPAHLDAAGVCRAAIESLAESFSDGVTAPLFWMAVLGLPGAAAYKAINTADSMIGHKTPRHLAFGWASARLDDLVNLPASRLTAWAIVVAALADDSASAASAVRAIDRDARRHKSPNAGWPEAAMAGALGLRLNGPKVYGDTRIEDAWMGDGRAEVNAYDIDRALRLYKRALLLIFALLALVWLGLVILAFG